MGLPALYSFSVARSWRTPISIIFLQSASYGLFASSKNMITYLLKSIWWKSCTSGSLLMFTICWWGELYICVIIVCNRGLMLHIFQSSVLIFFGKCFKRVNEQLSILCVLQTFVGSSLKMVRILIASDLLSAVRCFLLFCDSKRKIPKFFGMVIKTKRKHRGTTNYRIGSHRTRSANERS